MNSFSDKSDAIEPVKTIVTDHVKIVDPENGAILVDARGRQPLEAATPFVEGHVLITDHATGEVLVDTHNAIHPENMSQALALSLANRSSGFIDSMVFGNGASIESGTGAITYFPPNTIGPTASLYNQTYSKVVNDQSTLNTDITNNFITVAHIAGNLYTDIVVTCLLAEGEPSGQDAFDNATNINGAFLFDELGLRSFDPIAGNGLLLTHCIFNRTQKSLNRTIKIVYTLRILI